MKLKLFSLTLQNIKITKSEQKKLATSFKRAAKNPEIQAMAEEGLDDYLEQLKSLEFKKL